MTKQEIVKQIARETGVEAATVLAVVEGFMEEVRAAQIRKENVFLRGFGTFLIKRRKEKKGRNITKNTTIVIPAHDIPAFKNPVFRGWSANPPLWWLRVGDRTGCLHVPLP